MTSSRSRHATIGWACGIVLASALAACGGGGGDSGPAQPAASIDLTAGNRDSVSHAAAAGMLALSPTDTLPLAAGPAPVSAWAGRVLAQAIRFAALPAGAADGARARALALRGPYVDPCLVSGTMTSSVDDRDESQTVTPGDVLTIVYSSCRDSTFETLDGSVVSTYLRVDATAVSARVTMTGFRQAAARHAVTLDGSMRLDFSVPNSSEQVVSLLADGPVTAAVTTHLYTDTVTLLGGFVEQAVLDLSGRTSTSLRGSLDSAAVGGVVQVSTRPASPLTQYGTEPYPRAGTLQVDGKRGRLLMTALSADTVQLDLDADADGVAESSSTVTWDWVL